MADTPCPACLAVNDDDADECVGCGATLGEHSSPGVSPVLSSASAEPPRDNLIRARVGAGVELRAAEDGGEPNVLTGHFSQFNSWYEIESFWEGRFLERVLPGAFAETIKADRSNMRVLFDHGMDPNIGGKPLGPIRTLKEDDEGPFYEVPLLDTDYNRDFVVPALTGTLMNGERVGSQLGASFRFSVLEDSWNHKPKASKRNPDGVPERSIVRTKVYEFGPVTFPANPGASASARSISDEWLGRLIGDERFQRDFSERVGEKVARRILAAVPDDLRDAIRSKATSPAARARLDLLRRRARAILVTR